MCGMVLTRRDGLHALREFNIFHTHRRISNPQSIEGKIPQLSEQLANNCFEVIEG